MASLPDSHLPRSCDPATLVPSGADLQASSGTPREIPESQMGSEAMRRTGWSLWRHCGRKRGRHGVDTGPQPHQDQNVRQYNVVTLRAVGPVRLEMEAAVLHKGHSIIVIEGDVGLMSEFPVETHWISWVCKAIWMLPSAPSIPWEPGTP